MILDIEVVDGETRLAQGARHLLPTKIAEQLDQGKVVWCQGWTEKWAGAQNIIPIWQGMLRETPMLHDEHGQLHDKSFSFGMDFLRPVGCPLLLPLPSPNKPTIEARAPSTNPPAPVRSCQNKKQTRLRRHSRSLLQQPAYNTVYTKQKI